MRKLGTTGGGLGDLDEGELAAEALEGFEESALLGDYSGDSGEEGGELVERAESGRVGLQRRISMGEN